MLSPGGSAFSMIGHDTEPLLYPRRLNEGIALMIFRLFRSAYRPFHSPKSRTSLNSILDLDVDLKR